MIAKTAQKLSEALFVSLGLSAICFGAPDTPSLKAADDHQAGAPGTSAAPASHPTANGQGAERIVVTIDLGSPESAYRSFRAAARAGDEATLRTVLYAPDAPHEQLADAHAAMIVAGKRLADAMRARFGEDPFSRPAAKAATSTASDAAAVMDAPERLPAGSVTLESEAVAQIRYSTTPERWLTLHKVEGEVHSQGSVRAGEGVSPPTTARWLVDLAPSQDHPGGTADRGRNDSQAADGVAGSARRVKPTSATHGVPDAEQVTRRADMLLDLAECLNEVARDVADNRYRTPLDARAAVQEKFHGAVARSLESTTRGSTTGPTTHPAR